MKVHDVVIFTDGHADIPAVRGATLDGAELSVPSGSTINVGVDAEGAMTATFTVFVRSVRTDPSR